MTIWRLFKAPTTQKRLLLFVLTFSSIVLVKGQDSNPQDTTKKVTFAGIPMINYNSSLGIMVGGMGKMYYKLNTEDSISPSSSTMLVGMYSTSKTYMIAAIQKFYFMEDKWRAKVIAGYGDVFFQFNTAGQGHVDEGGVWVDYNTNVNMFHLSLQRKVLPNFYVGLEGTIYSASTKYEIENPTGEDVTSNSDMNSLGYNFSYDSRDNVNFPINGFFIEYKNNFIREVFGSTSEFDRFEIAANYFWDIKKNSKSILVSRIYANIASGDVPFEGQSFIGMDDLRGYSKGEFRGDQVYTAQMELRQNIHKKFGMIGFLGAGVAVNQFSDITNTEVAPSIGVGVRYLMIPSEKINIGIDVGIGKDDWSLSFRIGESFGR